MCEDAAAQTLIAHAILAGSCVYEHSSERTRYGPVTDYGTFGNIFVFSVTGILKYGLPSLRKNGTMISLFRLFDNSARLLALPCTVTQLYIHAGYSQDVALIHAISGAVPFALVLLNAENKALSEISILSNVISLTYVSFVRDHKWGYILAASSLYSFYLLKQIDNASGLPNSCLYPLSLCLFTYCARRALEEITE